MNFSSTKGRVIHLRTNKRNFCFKLETCILEEKKREEGKDLYRLFMGRITVNSELLHKRRAAAILGSISESICTTDRNVLPITC